MNIIEPVEKTSRNARRPITAHFNAFFLLFVLLFKMLLQSINKSLIIENLATKNFTFHLIDVLGCRGVTA